MDKPRLDRVVNQLQRIDVSSLTTNIFVESYQKTGTPVVITGLLPNCDWTLDYLCEQLGDRQFLLRSYGQTRYKQDKRQWANIGSGVEAQVLPFKEYAELLRNRQAHARDLYLAKCSIKNTPLSRTLAFNSIAAQLGLTQPFSDLNLWLGPGGHVECLHYDATDGTLVQLHGAKKVMLFPPSQLSNLYPFPLAIHFCHGLKLRSWFSQVYPETPDLKSFPKFAQALTHKHEVTLQQGELLYIPAGWWHEVTALGEEMVCSVNQFWQVSPRKRALVSVSVWRNYLGILFALPYIGAKLAIAVFSCDRQQKISKILQML